MMVDLDQFAENLEQIQTASWEQFPDMELYMEQVLSLIGGNLGRFSGLGNGARGLTANMVNNYVKDGYIPRPVNKKYGKTQVINLYLLALLKNVLPIPVLAAGLSGLELSGMHRDLYKRFAGFQDEAFSRTGERIKAELAAHPERSDDLRLFALELAAEANAMQLAAEKLLSVIAFSDGAET